MENTQTRVGARPSIHNHPGCIFAEGEMVWKSRPISGVYWNESDETMRQLLSSTRPEPGLQSRNSSQHSQQQPTATANSSNTAAFLRPELDCTTDYVNQTPSPIGTVVSRRSSSRNSVSSQDGTPYTEESEAENVWRCSTPVASVFRRNASSQTTGSYLESDHGGRPLVIIATIIGLLAIIVCALISKGCFDMCCFSHLFSSMRSQCQLNSDFRQINHRFGIDDTTLLRLRTGISAISDREDRGSFTFLYNSHSDFSHTKFDDFINDFTLATSKYLRNDSSRVAYTSVDGGEQMMIGLVGQLCEYRVQLAASGVLLLRHLEAVPARLAPALRYYCTEHDQLTKRTAIVFTFDVAACPLAHDVQHATPHALIERCLTEKWQQAPEDIVGPLLNRDVSVVVDVTSVF